MAHYNNDYTKEEDVMLWQLHEIRHSLAEKQLSPEQINTRAQATITQYNLTNLKIIRAPVRVPEGSVV